jgi:hypothetical protein
MYQLSRRLHHFYSSPGTCWSPLRTKFASQQDLVDIISTIDSSFTVVIIIRNETIARFGLSLEAQHLSDFVALLWRRNSTAKERIKCDRSNNVTLRGIKHRSRSGFCCWRVSLHGH